jgi:hypothetical protein
MWLENQEVFLGKLIYEWEVVWSRENRASKDVSKSGQDWVETGDVIS